MICPDCKNQMAGRTVMGVTVDECGSCRGVWFNRGELKPFLRRIRATPGRTIPSEEQFRLGNVSGTSPCPKCGESGFRYGVFRGISFGECCICSGLFLRESSIQSILESGRLQDWAPAQTESKLSVLEILLWALTGGQFVGQFTSWFPVPPPAESENDAT